MTSIVDFRLLGLILPKQSPQQLASFIQWWMAAGLIVAIFTGFMLFSVDPDSYFANATFLIKMGCLFLAIA
jgi:high-affinity Fe2+/Pb2+ permease